MADTQSIKKRLSKIQKNFNPEKNTYKVIEYVVNNNFDYNRMLKELSRIKGFSKYPEELKQEYISIINDIKENIIKQRKLEEKEKIEANTKELKDIIEHLEKSKNNYIERKHEEQSMKNETQIEEKKDSSIPKKQDNIKKKSENIEDKPIENEKNSKVNINKFIEIGIVLVIIVMILVLLFY